MTLSRFSRTIGHNAPFTAILISAAVLFFVAAASAQSTFPEGATDLTVRLFFTHEVSSLTITPASPAVTFKRCPHCPESPLTSPLTVKSIQSTMLVNGSSSQDLELSGALRLVAAPNVTANAAGKWRVRPSPDGLHVTLTVGSERYVMAVLMSEAAPNEPVASLQALAIVARSFALTHPNRHSTQEFNLCDSTHCQALHFGPVTDAVRDAVQQTAGETLWYHSRRATAYFTQNCGGTTEDAVQIWGGPQQSWLISQLDPHCQRTPSAWHASISATDLRQALSSSGWSLRSPISSVRVLSLDPSGRANRVQVFVGAQRFDIPASAFRFAIGRALGWNLVRSDWYSVNFSRGYAEFDGKGFGHGVGLCQAGAAAMAAHDHADMRTILSFYFPGTEVRITPSDLGWQSTSANRWTLINTVPAHTALLLREGNTALARARSIFPPTSAEAASNLTVRVFPSTELFRQTTGEPGWIAASTHGDTIALQPIEIIERHEPLANTLLHEMLHVLIERECSLSTPLWLREGLAESLASPHDSRSAAFLNLQQIDAALSASSSRGQAQRAHENAATAVRKLISGNGLAAVRGWLRTGVPASALQQAGLR
jgi:stage II sporulation protein D